MMLMNTRLFSADVTKVKAALVALSRETFLDSKLHTTIEFIMESKKVEGITNCHVLLPPKLSTVDMCTCQIADPRGFKVGSTEQIISNIVAKELY